ncbi:MAG: double-stranded DNA-binding protein [Nitrososphaerota archaeon]|jgi:DNA-binding TFAR19-related protein (PDSD5 family)|nr:double-stranded DNA-binding protein [Nitrososphaerota archaeon]MDG6930609.1 double-stranded DNA-binding protein [Nitrososphaerota archaeon]MDG6932766.1 double-stranded DNA-binding protein [Nitrososphaerota archaeon]MDG6935845.1 double-stranded DNA-binding protein [Nitrososphaerota archaeon]MDG6944166.1 double-stranded DNA-binding protein [Nitrososphaerota archaeon]
MSEDDEVEKILKKKMGELMKKKVSPQQKSDDPFEIVRGTLYDRGDEVLSAAVTQYPNETRLVVSKLAELIKNGTLNYKISGSELLYIFRSMGLPVSIETTIKIERNGRSLSLSDMLKQED